jgi:hypothetical protein
MTKIENAKIIKNGEGSFLIMTEVKLPLSDLKTIRKENGHCLISSDTRVFTLDSDIAYGAPVYIWSPNIEGKEEGQVRDAQPLIWA